MQDFLDNPEQQTPERALEIIGAPLYKELRKSLSATEYARHPVLPRFVEKSNDVLRPVLRDRLRDLIQETGENG